jgi:RNA polymerase sigma-70 factor (ECF subfamily)
VDGTDFDAAPAPVVDAATVAALHAGDREAFGRLSERHFRELHVHCYRMVGSFDEAEDLVQEALLRAWRHRATFAGRSTVRAWLYRIATNVCIEALRKRPRRPAPTATDGAPPCSRFPWLQPYPDELLDAVAADDARPDARAVERESVELAFLAAIQLLPAKQRAVLILRDVLEFSAGQTAEVLDDSVPAVNSALQRARVTLRRHQEATDDGPAGRATTLEEHVLLRLMMDAQERADAGAIVDLLRADVRMTLLPDGLCWDGRDEVAPQFHARLRTPGAFRCVPIAANRQPAFAVYLRDDDADDAVHRATAIVLLEVVDGRLRNIATFLSAELFARFGLPPVAP